MDNPYTKISSIIEDWSIKNYYSDMVVRIFADGVVFNELLLFHDIGNYTPYYWLNDWYEGQEHVELIGFIPVDQITLVGLSGWILAHKK